MILWTRFLDWLFGVRLMSMKDLIELEHRTLNVIAARFLDVNDRIDTDEDGQISVREAWTLIKGMAGSIREIMGGILR